VCSRPHRRRAPAFSRSAPEGCRPAWRICGDGLAWLRGTTEAAGCRVLSIHDGDTLRATCNGHETVKVRLYCMDASELAQRPWGTASRDHLRRITPREVSLRIRDTDRYGRKVAEVLDPATSNALNRAMVAAGQAAVYRRYCCAYRSYRQAEASARTSGLGIWRTQGEHQRPWDYRSH
jgi:endonuclease YncB( thermonuclease family)